MMNDKSQVSIAKMVGCGHQKGVLNKRVEAFTSYEVRENYLINLVGKWGESCTSCLG